MWCLQVLQPLQIAKMVVQGYPFFFDMLAVVSCCAEDVGDPPVRQLMAGEGTRANPVKGEHNTLLSSFSAPQEHPAFLQAS